MLPKAATQAQHAALRLERAFSRRLGPVACEPLTIALDPLERNKKRRPGTNAEPPLLGLSRSSQNAVAGYATRR